MKHFSGFVFTFSLCFTVFFIVLILQQRERYRNLFNFLWKLFVLTEGLGNQRLFIGFQILKSKFTTKIRNLGYFQIWKDGIANNDRIRRCFSATYLSFPWRPLWTGSPAAAAAAASHRPPPGSQTPCYTVRNQNDSRPRLDKIHLHLYLRKPKAERVVKYIRHNR